jgi:hypothetical protein
MLKYKPRIGDRLLEASIDREWTIVDRQLKTTYNTITNLYTLESKDYQEAWMCDEDQLIKSVLGGGMELVEAEKKSDAKPEEPAKEPSTALNGAKFEVGERVSFIEYDIYEKKEVERFGTVNSVVKLEHDKSHFYDLITDSGREVFKEERDIKKLGNGFIKALQKFNEG